MATTSLLPNVADKTCFIKSTTQLQGIRDAHLPNVSRMAYVKRPLTVAMATKKKVNSYDDQWTKSFFSYGYFAEDFEEDKSNILKKVEKKKLLSNIEKAGLLSKLESFGFSLSKIEKLGLLSKAEDFGLLAIAEKFASTSPGVLASLSLPLVAGAVLTPLLIPDEPAALLYGQYVLASALGVAGLGAFGASIVLGILLEE